MAQLAGDRGEGVERVAGDQPQLCAGPVTSVNDTCWRLLAVGRGAPLPDDAQQLVVRHGSDVKARLERRMRHRSST